MNYRWASLGCAAVLLPTVIVLCVTGPFWTLLLAAAGFLVFFKVAYA